MSDHTKINQQNKQQDQKRQEQSHENSSAMQSFAPPDSAIQPITDNRPGTVAQRRLQELMDKSPQVQAGSQLQSMIDSSPRQVAQRKALKNIFGGDTAPVQRKAEEEEQTIQAKENNTGLPDNLKTGVENLSGMSMDDVKVHYSSARPKELNALAYAQGNDIHLGPGQEKHLAHEAWHVVQQRQGRVQPTMQMKGVAVNDEDGLEKEADVMGEKAKKDEETTTNIVETAKNENKEDDELKSEYVTLPEISDQLSFSVGKPDEKHPQALINFTCDVKLIQNKLKELGLFSEEDYNKESNAASSVKFSTTGYKTVSENTSQETDAKIEPLSMNEIEKAFMLKYKKIPIGPQTEYKDIPSTIKAIEVFQKEVKRSKDIDGRVDAGQGTIGLVLNSSKESVAAARQKYKVDMKNLEEEKKRKAEEYRKKQEEEKKLKEEEAKKLAQEKAEQEKLKNEPVDKNNIKLIRNLYSDMRELGAEMRKYSKYNPVLVINMLDYLDYSEKDNLAYNIASNFSDPDLAALDKVLLNKLLVELESGWTKDMEELQRERIKNALKSKPVKASSITMGNITHKDMEKAAKDLNVEAAALMAIAQKETGPQGSFYKKGQATILFERHRMYDNLKKAGYDAKDLSDKNSDIVNKSSGGYGKYSSQYPKLERAKALDTASAIKSASWGKFQVMGENYKWGGYASPQEMENAMNVSELEQLSFFVGFIKNKNNGALIKALNDHNWEKVAELYNGTKWKTINPDYATKIEKYYNDFKKKGF